MPLMFSVHLISFTHDDFSYFTLSAAASQAAIGHKRNNVLLMRCFYDLRFRSLPSSSVHEVCANATIMSIRVSLIFRRRPPFGAGNEITALASVRLVRWGGRETVDRCENGPGIAIEVDSLYALLTRPIPVTKSSYQRKTSYYALNE